MYDDKLEELIDMALADGVLTDKEKQVLFKRAESMGIDLDEFEVVLEGRLAKMKNLKTPIPAKEKLGNMVTCPACGALVTGGTAVCQECGYEFRNVKTNAALQKLTQQLEAANESEREGVSLGRAIGNAFGMRNKYSKTETVLMNFPVPNTSEDLLEILSFTKGFARRHMTGSSLYSSNVDFRTEQAYWVLYEKCINKARMSFAKDSRFQEYYDHYNLLKKGKTYEQKYMTKYLLISLGLLTAVAIIISIGIYFENN